jgi:phosphoglucomutase
VARSVSTSHQIDRVAWRRGIEVIETPVGFKFIGELIKQDKLILGGEENGGLSIKGHYPEKDGILACLLVAEMVAATGASLKELLDDLYAKDGRLWNARIGMKLTEEMRARFSERWSENQSQRIAGRVVTSTEQVDDGVKLVLDNGSWMLLRLSTTEPIVRCCIEATSEVELNELLEASKRLVI